MRIPCKNITLGMDFMMNNDLQINLLEIFILIDGRCYMLDENLDSLISNRSKILGKTKILIMKSEDMTSEDLIKHYKIYNQKIGLL